MPWKLQETPDSEAQLDNGEIVKPLATLSLEGGAKTHIIRDDNCYVVILSPNAKDYRITPFIFKEALETLQKLPPLLTDFDNYVVVSGKLISAGKPS
jgi:hypothetical protein